MLERYSPAELISFARRLGPGLTARDFADAGRQLDQIDDDAFTRYGLTRRDVTALRDSFAAWPRTAQAATARPQEAGPADTAAAPPAADHDGEPEPGRRHRHEPPGHKALSRSPVARWRATASNHRPRMNNLQDRRFFALCTARGTTIGTLRCEYSVFAAYRGRVSADGVAVGSVMISPRTMS